MLKFIFQDKVQTYNTVQQFNIFQNLLDSFSSVLKQKIEMDHVQFGLVQHGQTHQHQELLLLVNLLNVSL